MWIPLPGLASWAEMLPTIVTLRPLWLRLGRRRHARSWWFLTRARLTESRRQHLLSPFQKRSQGSCSGRPERRRRDELANRAGAHPDQYRAGVAVPRSAAHLALLYLYPANLPGSDADVSAEPAEALAAADRRRGPRIGRAAPPRVGGRHAQVR